jgi:hypothetical protein
MAFPSTAVFENANRANASSLGSDWSAPTFSTDISPSIISNAIGLTATTASGDAVNTLLGSLTGPIEAFCTYAATGGNAGVEYFVTGYGTATPNGYRLYYNVSTTELRIAKYTAGGSFTTILAVTQALAAGDAFGVSVTAAGVHQIQYKAAAAVNFSAVGGTITDTTWTSGYIGIFISSTSTATRLDDVGGGIASPKTYTVTTGVISGGGGAALADGVDQTAATRADGWTVAKVASTNMSQYAVGTKLGSGTFSTTPVPATALGNDSFEIPASLNGTFAAAPWVFTFAVRATTASAQAGRMRMRVFKSTSAFSGPYTELTSAIIVGSTSAALSTTADVTSVITWNPGTPITLNNEYLFFALAWEITTAGGSNNSDVQIRTGQAAGGSRLATPTFTPTVNTPISDTDANSTTTESGSIVASTLVSGTDSGSSVENLTTAISAIGDPNGATTEATTSVAKVSNTDVNSTTTESASVSGAATPISASDTNGTVTESAALIPVTGLAVWLDASQLGLGNGASVSSWTNLANAAVPGTVLGTPSPTYVTPGLQGKGVVRFLAGQGAIRLNGTGASSPFTLLYVAHMTSTGANAQRIGAAVFPENLLFGWWTGQQDCLFDGAWAAGQPTSCPPVTTDWKLYSFDKTGTNPVRMFSDGTFLTNGGSGSQDLGGTFGLSGYDVSPGTETSDCEVAEVLIYNRVLTDTERQQAESYLRNKWFVTSTPISATDVNGTTTDVATSVAKLNGIDVDGVLTESAPLTSQIGSSDVDGATTETLSLINKPALIDVNSTTTETAAFAFNQLTPDTNGVTTETASVIVTNLIATDVYGTTTEATSTVGIAQTSDVGTIADTASIGTGTPIPATDTSGTVTETAGVPTFNPQSADTSGATTEAPAIVAKPISSDTDGVPVEASVFVASIIISDANGLTETSTPKTIVTGTDANGTTTEAGSNATFNQVAASDTNSTVTEISLLVAPITFTDSNGSTAETATNTNATVTTTDANSATAETTASILVTIGDTNTSTVEAFALVAQIISDGGSTFISEIGSIGTSKVGLDANSTTTETVSYQFAQATIDQNGVVNEAVVYHIVLGSLDIVITFDSSAVRVFERGADFFTGYDDGVAKIAGLLTGKPGKIVHMTRGDIYVVGAGKAIHTTRGRIVPRATGRIR